MKLMSNRPRPRGTRKTGLRESRVESHTEYSGEHIITPQGLRVDLVKLENRSVSRTNTKLTYHVEDLVVNP